MVAAPAFVSFFCAFPTADDSAPMFAALAGRVHAVTFIPADKADLAVLWMSLTSIPVEEAAGGRTPELTRGVLSHPARLLVRLEARRPDAFTYWQVTPADLNQVELVTEERAAELTMDGAVRLQAIRIVAGRYAAAVFPRWRRAARKRGVDPSQKVGVLADNLSWAIVERLAEPS